MNDNIDQTAEKLGEQMKKGFVSHLILLVLNNNPSHGYKIIQQIETRTLGMWNPSTSTIYHVLESLEEKDLIECIQEQSEGRQKKVYAITEKGKNALKMLINIYKNMQESMKRMILSSIRITEEIDEKKVECFLPHDLHLLNMKEIGSVDKQLKSLKIKRILISQRLKQLKRAIKMIDIEIERLSIQLQKQERK
ncbi:MAG: hypothetical protein BAJALOKI1v1_1730008 [Promethearchaeota archaeon]|nr:MAG: hypothetical protein BAJALOKI1v1_1730008 [Candidatus Lokiarchaeota archaeon]